VVTWQEGFQLCVPLLSILKESNYDEETASRLALDFIRNRGYKLDVARQYIDACISEMAEGTSFLDNLNKDQFEFQDAVLAQERREINWLRSIRNSLQ
jgi:hypothetical protein